ncbi:class I SAM-dependent methyltransferase [Nocardia sp. NEAU-G5]|uniref:Class I SAM-dependent methyltransferase n=1 Tax=Nocardia albiluteola TaxID=2842303 RepID=A0ABS6BE96_9NOCA|nr:class I SAM-dependent methyltransferase [Nocardia albiluteola]MBU3068100.1 class I SAM-dependent methyltransferase [Nocardia albiluteola]
MSFSTRHRDRERAESFGAGAGRYDRYRPDYPQELISDLQQLKPTSVLDVGCGTGKAAAALSARDLPTLGIEPDERMARLAQNKGIPVEISNFETWDPGTRRFDLIVSADAWHWVDPERGARQAANILPSGGHIARFWSFHVLEDSILEEFVKIYNKYAPEASVGGGRQKSTESISDPLVNNIDFASAGQRTYRWELTLSTEDWIGLICTFSDHQRLAPHSRAALLKCLRDVIENLGGSVRTSSGTFVQIARRL